MNPAMKQAPKWVVASTVYHEMIHEAIPTRRNPRTRRRISHGPEFKNRERLYPYFYESKKWKKENAYLILRSDSAPSKQSQSPSSYQTFEGFSIGQVVQTTSGKKFEVTGFKPRNWKFPIIARNLQTNASYKLSKDQIVSGGSQNKEIKSLIKKATTGVQKLGDFEVGQAIKVLGAGPRLSKRKWKIVEFKPRSKCNVIVADHNGKHYRVNYLQVAAV